jgi:hypothetical protein
MCHRSVGLIQRGIEEAGIPTVSVTHLPRVTTRIRVSRALQIPWPMGQAFGPANSPDVHHDVVLTCLELLHAATGPTLAQFSDP